MGNAPDFLKKAAEVDSKIDVESMTKLADLIAAYDEAAEEMDHAELVYKNAKEAFNKLALEALPEFLLQHGINQLALKDGRKITVKESISATVKDDAKFRAWLADRDETDIIKVNYKFGRLEPTMSRKLADFLMDEDFDFEIDESIHAQTKQKYFRELINEVPRHELPDWVTIYDVRKATVK